LEELLRGILDDLVDDGAEYFGRHRFSSLRRGFDPLLGRAAKYPNFGAWTLFSSRRLTLCGSI
jgi:hypothetical protein